MTLQVFGFRFPLTFKELRSISIDSLLWYYSRCLQSEVSLIPFHVKIPNLFKVRFLDSFHVSIARVAPEVAK